MTFFRLSPLFSFFEALGSGETGRGDRPGVPAVRSPRFTQPASYPVCQDVARHKCIASCGMERLLILGARPSSTVHLSFLSLPPLPSCPGPRAGLDLDDALPRARAGSDRGTGCGGVAVCSVGELLHPGQCCSQRQRCRQLHPQIDLRHREFDAQALQGDRGVEAGVFAALRRLFLEAELLRSFGRLESRWDVRPAVC